ncbi:hypothetical protein Tsubulata_038119 [Turnera subulata]|uniref:Uncharacterized protein n=1 Tax=Turnera subulata TaxID=218843 RepID=A0A9Q0FAA2_9ROSI|nr:hypothetical protein Tsubulata_038119 [Turnera subulata]
MTAGIVHLSTVGISVRSSSISPIARDGPFVIDDCNKAHPNIQLAKGGRWYELENISQANTLLINDKEFQKQLSSNSYESFNSFSLSSFPSLSLQIVSNLTLLKCKPTAHAPSRLKYIKCNDFFF